MGCSRVHQAARGVRVPGERDGVQQDAPGSMGCWRVRRGVEGVHRAIDNAGASREGDGVQQGTQAKGWGAVGYTEQCGMLGGVLGSSGGAQRRAWCWGAWGNGWGAAGCIGQHGVPGARDGVQQGTQGKGWGTVGCTEQYGMLGGVQGS